jgi:nucleoside diphosphate kinase
MKLSGRMMEVMNAFGVGKTGGSTTGKKLNVTSIQAQRDEVTGEGFVQLITSDPLSVYRLPMEQAVEIAQQLINATGERQ